MGDYNILMQFDIDADRSAVHDALATEGGIRSWWSSHTDGPSRDQLRVSFPDVPQPFEFTVSTDESERVEWVTGGFPAVVGRYIHPLGPLRQSGSPWNSPPLQPSRLRPRQSGHPDRHSGMGPDHPQAEGLR
jgi:hypothetical protein